MSQVTGGRAKFQNRDQMSVPIIVLMYHKQTEEKNEEVLVFSKPNIISKYS